MSRVADRAKLYADNVMAPITAITGGSPVSVLMSDVHAMLVRAFTLGFAAGVEDAGLPRRVR